MRKGNCSGDGVVSKAILDAVAQRTANMAQVRAESARLRQVEPGLVEAASAMTQRMAADLAKTPVSRLRSTLRNCLLCTTVRVALALQLGHAELWGDMMGPGFGRPRARKSRADARRRAEGK